jgi:hypothetical protein
MPRNVRGSCRCSRSSTARRRVVAAAVAGRKVTAQQSPQRARGSRAARDRATAAAHGHSTCAQNTARGGGTARACRNTWSGGVRIPDGTTEPTNACQRVPPPPRVPAPRAAELATMCCGVCACAWRVCVACAWGVRTLSFASVSAPRSSSSVTTDARSPYAARCSGVMPYCARTTHRARRGTAATQQRVGAALRRGRGRSGGGRWRVAPATRTRRACKHNGGGDAMPTAAEVHAAALATWLCTHPGLFAVFVCACPTQRAPPPRRRSPQHQAALRPHPRP